MLQEYDTPTDVLQNGDYTPVPIMFGSNSHEGSFIHAELYNDFLLGNDLVNDTDFWTHEYMIDLLRYRKPTVLDRSNKPRGGTRTKVTRSFIGLGPTFSNQALFSPNP